MSRGKQSDEFYNLKENFVGYQQSFDFYPTPDTCINIIMKDMKNIIKEYFEYDELDFLEPNAGVGGFLKGLIDHKEDLKIKSITALEISPPFVEILKENYKIDYIQQTDFLKWNSKEEYKFIVMNPPFRDYVDYQGKRKTYDAWLFHLYKALLLPFKLDKYIYIILPDGPRTDDLFNYNIKLSPMEKDLMKTKYKIDYKDLPDYQIEELGKCDNFIKFNIRGKPSKMGLRCKILRILAYGG